MPTNVNLQQIIINSIPSKEIYDQMKAQGLLEPNQLYLVEEDPSVADMTKAVYDANGVVQNAGGIVEYVAANGGKIDVIKINSTPVPIVDKAVDIDIPTKLSELTDDATHRIVTDTEKAAWNAKGSYSKPSGGIPKTDLASSVQGSLSKADSALQSFTETDPVFKASPAYGISSNDIESWDNKQGPISDLGTIRNNAAAGAAKVSCTDQVVASFGYTKNTGDMEEAIYDPDGLVAAAGGIPEYVESHSINPSEKGNSNGVATLDANGKLSASQIPEMDYIPTSQKGAASGVASLGGDGKVPTSQIPSLGYIPTSQKGVANGVASLGSDGKVPSSQLTAVGYSKSETLTAATAALYGLSSTAVPNNVFNTLSGSALYSKESYITHPAGEVWNQASFDGSFAYNRHIVYGNNVFVGFRWYSVNSSNNTIPTYSVDGKAWHPCVLPNDSFAYGQIIFDGTRFLLLGAKNGSIKLYSSVNGQTFTVLKTFSNGESGYEFDGLAMVYGNGVYLISAAFAGSSVYLLRSSDLNTWEYINVGANVFPRALSYGNNTFIFLENTGNYYPRYSTDGRTWTANSSYRFYHNLDSLCFFNGYHVLISHANGASDNSSYPYRLYYTTDGRTWNNSINFNIRDTELKLSPAGNKLFITGRENTTRYTDDLQTIKQISTPATGSSVTLSVAFGGGKYVMQTPSNNFFYSEDIYGIRPFLKTPSGENVFVDVDSVVNGVKIETGSYAGTGTYGASNPNILTFGFMPKLFGVIEAVNKTGGRTILPNIILFGANRSANMFYTSTNSTMANMTFSGTTVSWYTTDSYASQLNGTDFTYNYFAIG